MALTSVLKDYFEQKRHRFQNRSRMGKVWVVSKILILLISFAYFTTIAFPQPFFRYKITKRKISLYCNDKKVSKSGDILNRIEALLSKSELYDPTRHFRIFICNSYPLFSYFAPKASTSFAINNPIGSNVFIANADVGRDLSYCNKSIYNVRALSAVAAHELTHILIRKKIGILREARTPWWIKEGYCEYIANNSSLNYDTGIQMLLEGKDDGSISFKYLRSRLMVEYLIRGKHENLSNLLRGDYNETQIKDETVDYLRKIRAKH